VPLILWRISKIIMITLPGETIETFRKQNDLLKHVINAQANLLGQQDILVKELTRQKDEALHFLKMGTMQWEQRRNKR